MASRAKYTGPHSAVIVEVSPGRTVEVEQGHQLPTDVDGETIPATVRDSLLETSDWSEVTAPSTQKKES